MKDHNQEGRTEMILLSDNPCEMNKSMASLIVDGTASEDLRRRSIYEIYISYKAFRRLFFPLFERNLGTRERGW